MTSPLVPGAVIGILGGGQLGRMLALAAARLGLRCHVYDPAPDGPAMQVTNLQTVAGFDDADAVKTFAMACDVVTYEFENIPDTALDLIEEFAPVRPSRRALRTSQDRLTEKTFLQELGIKTAPFQDITDEGAVIRAAAELGVPAIIKTRRFGYDGKGQHRLADADAGTIARAWDALKGQPLIYEGFVDFEREISVIAARGVDGAVSVFDPGENVHEEGILRTTQVPARITKSLSSDAALIAGKILNALDYIGVMGVEFFVVGGKLMVNEFAPRVHNSGHWTQNACNVDQFEQHIRAVAGWPLSPALRHADARMENLIGDEVSAWKDVVSDGLHLYGKAEARPGRKMGHINRTFPLGTLNQGQG